MGNIVEKYYKKDDNSETANYFIRLGKKLYISCPQICHYCLGYLESEHLYVEDIEAGPVEKSPIFINKMDIENEDYDIPTIEEFQ